MGVTDDAVVEGLRNISAADRALLELTVRQRVGDERISSLLGVSHAEVRSRRRSALAALGEQLGDVDVPTARRSLEALDPDAWPHDEAPSRPEDTAVPPGDDATPPPADLAPFPPAVPAPEVPLISVPAGGEMPVASGGRPRRLAAVVAAALLVLVLLVLALQSGDGDDTPAASTPVPATTARPPAPDPLALPRVTTPAGRALRTGRELRLAVAGLAAGGVTYRVWLYTRIIGARPIGILHGPAGRITVRLPADTRGFRYVDLSRQSPGMRGHSGRSVLRIPLSALRSGGAADLKPPAL